jgi:hypothetical protein
MKHIVAVVMKIVVVALVIVLLVIHQDDWFFNFWRNPNLVFGFMPQTLLYHAGISLAAGITWYLATVFTWPKELQQQPTEPPEGGPSQ